MNKPFYCGPHDRSFAIGGHCPDCAAARGVRAARAAADDALSEAGLGVPIDVGPVVNRMEQHNAEAREALANFRAAASSLDTQVAGDHYKKLKIQPIEYIHANGIPFAEGSVIKYVTRWREKGGIKDLEKARHFLDLLIELEQKKASP
jgi:hypothetical protein